MFRRLLLLIALPVLVLAYPALAGDAPLPVRILSAVCFSLSTDDGPPLSIPDPAGDIYHAAGMPGYTGGNIDIRGVGLSVWVPDPTGVPPGTSNPFEPSLVDFDDIRRHSPAALDFAVDGP